MNHKQQHTIFLGLAVLRRREREHLGYWCCFHYISDHVTIDSVSAGCVIAAVKKEKCVSETGQHKSYKRKRQALVFGLTLNSRIAPLRHLEHIRELLQATPL